MKNYFFKLLLIATAIFFNCASAQVRIACIDDDIAAGTNTYPAQLQQMLGNAYKVSDFAASSATISKTGGNSYLQTPEFKQAINSRPDIVLISLGAFDSKPVNRAYTNDLKSDYKALIDSFRNLEGHPRIVILLPAVGFTAQVSDDFVVKSIIPKIQQLAFEDGLEILNLYPLFIDKSAMFPDKEQLNSAGAKIIADRVYEHLKGNFDTSFNVTPKITEKAITKSFYGFTDHQFMFNGRSAHIVKPKRAAKGNPWVWRARFWGHEPQTDVALLERGFHIVYCDVIELYGNQQAISIWNNFYAYLRQMKFARKAVLEGMSRGGVYIYNWAAVNPDKVACVYADNPVLDMRSWPGGKGKGPGSKGDWEMFKRDYGYTTEEQAATFRENPLDKVKEIVKGKYSMLHVCADEDEAVPIEENTTLFEQKVKELGGDIMVIHKPGFKHHPHSLPNPTPIVDFVLKAVKMR